MRNKKVETEKEPCPICGKMVPIDGIGKAGHERSKFHQRALAKLHDNTEPFPESVLNFPVEKLGPEQKPLTPEDDSIISPPINSTPLVTPTPIIPQPQPMPVPTIKSNAEKDQINVAQAEQAEKPKGKPKEKGFFEDIDDWLEDVI